jgi:hypothetical protein
MVLAVREAYSALSFNDYVALVPHAWRFNNNGLLAFGVDIYPVLQAMLRTHRVSYEKQVRRTLCREMCHLLHETLKVDRPDVPNGVTRWVQYKRLGGSGAKEPALCCYATENAITAEALQASMRQ